MLTNKKLTIAAETVIDDVKIASYGAIMSLDTMELSLINRQIDKDACKLHREVVRADQAAFEDYAYSLQDMLKNQ